MNQDQARAVRAARAVLERLKVLPGLTEIRVAQHIRTILAEFGAKTAFRTIVASGKRSAIPHGFATNKKIKAGELVVVDFGANVRGWRSDVTRTYLMGKGTSRQKKLLSLVRLAQRQAIAGVKAGVRCCDVDRIARDYLQKHKLDKYFVHSTGHGIGLKVHQAPKISRKNRHRLQVGRVICIEPGVYFRGYGGVRWEDMVQVTAKGCKILT